VKSLDLLFNSDKKIFSYLMRGVEKENLRVSYDGQLSHKPHPASLGKALTHPTITTDFSESLSEIITPPLIGRENMLGSLENISAYAWHHLDLEKEYFWPMSMPVSIAHEDDIPIADYGTSHSGRFKKLYRQGLVTRYGKRMQIIAGVHYNFSFPSCFFEQVFKGQDKSDVYFILLRNYFRNYWILPYLFGASPACDKSLVNGRDVSTCLESFLGNSLIGEYATSLRMSDIGYQNKSQSQICISLNNPHAYARSLKLAVSTPYPEYTELGVFKNNQRIQLNDHLLQIENEYYSPIRPKQIAEAGERPTEALCRRGVRYIEVRVLDLNPFTPLGITPTQSAFMDVFLTYCALGSDRPLDKPSFLNAKANFKQVVCRGRAPECLLNLENKNIEFKAAAEGLFSKLLELAQVMDLSIGAGSNEFSSAIRGEKIKIDDVSQTPSAQILACMQDRNLSHQEFGLAQAEAHRAYFEEIILSPVLSKQMDAMTEQSIKDERAEVLNSKGNFEDYLSNFY